MTRLKKSNRFQQGFSDLIIMGIVALVMGGVVWYIHGVKVDRDIAKSNLKIATENYDKANLAIELQQTTINQLSELRRIDAETMSILAANNTAVIAKFDAKKSSRSDLEKTNVQVKSYLDESVPADLRSVFNKSNSKYFGPNENQGRTPASGPVEGTAQASN